MTELLWNITEIENFEELIIPNGHGGETIGRTTYALIYATHLIKLPKIAEGNYVEFYERMDLVRHLLPFRFDKNARIIESDVSLEDVKRHIGLETNATYMDSLDWDEEMRELGAI